MSIRLAACQIVFLGAMLVDVTAIAAPYEVGDATCLNDPECQIKEEQGKTVIDKIKETTGGNAKPQVFLMKHQGRFVGVPMGARDVSQIVDLSEAPASGGDPVWDGYQIGAYYAAPGSDPHQGGQIWQVRFSTQEHTRVTDGRCIPVAHLTRSNACTYQGPIEAAPGRLAFFQQLSVYEDGELNTTHHLVTVIDGQASVAEVLEHLPDHLSWSPDREWLLFVEGGELQALDLRGDKPKLCILPKVSTYQVRHPEWAGKGMIVYEAAGDIWMVPVKMPNGPKSCPDLRLKQQVQLTSGSDHDKDPQWMEASNLIAFTSNRPVDAADTSRRNRIWVGQLGGDVLDPAVSMPFSIGYADWQIYLK